MILVIICIEKMETDELIIDLTEVKELISSTESNYQIVDIRPSTWFEKGHLETATNIPLNTVLGKENKSFWEQEETTKILYGDEGSPVSSIHLLLLSKGYKNIKALNGAYIINSNQEGEYIEDTESAKFDFVAVFDEINKKNKKEFLPLPVNKPKKIALKPKPVNKVEAVEDEDEEEEEGC